MRILRTDLQVALNDLHVAAQQSADEYHSGAAFINDEAVGQQLATIAQEREQLAVKLEGMIASTGDLPSTPDPDRETGEELLNRLHAAFSADQVTDVLQQRLDSDEDLAQQIAGSRDAGLGEEYETIRAEFERHIQAVRTRLQAELAEWPSATR